MQAPTPSTSTPSTSSTPLLSHTRSLPDSSQLQRISEIFSVSWPSDAPLAQQHQQCFQAVVTACEKGSGKS